MPPNLLIDCLLFRDRFLWRLRGNIGPGRSAQMTCSQKEKYRECALLYSHQKTDCGHFHRPGDSAGESGTSLLPVCRGSVCVGGPFLTDFSTKNEISTKFYSITSSRSQYRLWYFNELTFQEDAAIRIWGLEDGMVGPRLSFWIGGSPFPSEPTANSGKSVIFTSNGTKSGSAEFGRDLPPRSPEEQLIRFTKKNAPKSFLLIKISGRIHAWDRSGKS